MTNNLRSGQVGKKIWQYDDLRSAETDHRVITLLKEPSIIEMPPISEQHNQKYRWGKHDLNPVKLTCACRSADLLHSAEIIRNIRNVCPHLSSFFLKKIPNEIPGDIRLLMEVIKRFPAEQHFIVEDDEEKFYLGITPENYWISVYLRQTNWIRVGYHLLQKRWAHNVAPKDPDRYLDRIGEYIVIGK
jgi:hypothetical protein